MVVFLVESGAVSLEVAFWDWPSKPAAIQLEAWLAAEPSLSGAAWQVLS